MKLTVDGTEYTIHFRYKLKEEITICSVTWTQGPNSVHGLPRPFVALDAVQCVKGDQFSRRVGRLKSLNKAIEGATPLRIIKSEFLTRYEDIDPEPVPPPKRVPVEVTKERREELRAAGQEGKQERRLLRTLARAARHMPSLASWKAEVTRHRAVASDDRSVS